MHTLHCNHKDSNCQHCFPNGYFLNNSLSHQHYYQNHQQSARLSTAFPYPWPCSNGPQSTYYDHLPNQNNSSTSSSMIPTTAIPTNPSWSAYQSSYPSSSSTNISMSDLESSAEYFDAWDNPLNDPRTMSMSTSNTGMMGQGLQTPYQYQYQTTTPANSFYSSPQPQTSVLPPSPSTPSVSTTKSPRAPKRKRLPKTPSTTPTTPRTPKPKKPKVKPTIIDDEVALKIFRDLRVTTAFLNSGKVLAWALPPDDPAFVNIHDYVYRSQEHAFGVKILSILRIIPQANCLELETSPPPLSFSEDPFTQGRLRKMLWHGTRKNCLTAILENGLKLPASHGQMFGSGIYFADRVSKSCQYCDNTGRRKGTAYLFLCDVLLGSMFEAYTAMPQLTQPPEEYIAGIGSIQYDSVKGIGNNVPDKQWDQIIDGCVWPTGPTVPNKERADDGAVPSLNFNEYIVYDTKQVQPKYLVKVEFTKQPVHENLY